MPLERRKSIRASFPSLVQRNGRQRSRRVGCARRGPIHGRRAASTRPAEEEQPASLAVCG